MEKHIEINGREIPLRYTVNAMCAMEDRAGGALQNLMDRQFSATRLLLWGGMLHAQPELPIREVGELITEYLRQGGSLEEIVEICAQALQDAGFLRDVVGA